MYLIQKNTIEDLEKIHNQIENILVDVVNLI